MYNPFRSSVGCRLRAVFFQLFVFVCCSSVLRMVLHKKFGPNLQLEAGELFRLYAVGGGLDFMVGLLVLLPVAMFCLKRSEKALLGKTGTWVGRISAGIWWGVILFSLQAEYFFFHEYASRFNTVAIDYLHYWTEVSANIKQMYPIKQILSVCIIGAVGIVTAAVRWFQMLPGADVRRGGPSRGV